MPSPHRILPSRHSRFALSGAAGLSLSFSIVLVTAPVAAQQGASGTHDTTSVGGVSADSAAAKQAACAKLKAYGRQVATDTIKAMAKSGTLFRRADSNSNQVSITLPRIKLDPATMPDSIRSVATTAGSSCNAVPAQPAMLQIAMGHASGLMNRPRPVIGVQLQPLTARDTAGLGLADPHGVLVQNVTPGYGAAGAGIVKGDVIVALDGKPVASVNQFMQQAQSWKDEQIVSVEVVRKGGAHQKLDVTTKMSK